MTPAAATKEMTERVYAGLLLAATLGFLGTIGVGLVAGAITALPVPLGGWATMKTLQPLHTALAIGWLLVGSLALMGRYGADERPATLVIAWLQLTACLLFLGGSVISVGLGRISGREYLTWPPAVSVPLAVALLLHLLTIVRSWARLVAHSGEAAWLLLLGALLLPAGLAESHLYLLDAVAADPGRDLAIQWHALDTVIAAWIVTLYGIGMLLLPPGAKPARGRWLFLVAALGILLDFGHHNYPSPQAHFIKIISFSATMLAAISFLRHLRALRRGPAGRDPVRQCLRGVERWTLFSVGTGILLAIPHLNLYAHGTHVVVAHTMGSIIGVNTLILLIAGQVWTASPSSLRPQLVHWNEVFLGAFCAVVAALGVAKGILRVEHDFLTWSALLRPYYAFIPLAALPLAGTLTWLGIDLARAAWKCVAAVPADAGRPADAPRFAPSVCVAADAPVAVDRAAYSSQA